MWRQLCFKFNDSLAVSLSGCIQPRIVGIESTNFSSGLLEGMETVYPYF